MPKPTKEEYEAFCEQQRRERPFGMPPDQLKQCNESMMQGAVELRKIADWLHGDAPKPIFVVEARVTSGSN